MPFSVPSSPVRSGASSSGHQLDVDATDDEMV